MHRRAAFFLALPLLAACHGRVEPSPEELRKYRNVAIIARVEGDASSELAQYDADGAAAFSGGLAGEEGDKAVSQRLTRALTRFVIGRRVEEGSRIHLPPGLFDVVSPTAVARALDLFLVDQQDQPLDYERLAKLRVDAVLEITVNKYGLRRAAPGMPAGGYARGWARLCTLDGETIWRIPFDVDESRDRTADLSGADFSKDPEQQWRETVDRIADGVGRSIGADLAPKAKLDDRLPGPDGPAATYQPGGGAERPPDAVE